jgi:hypothetical protein
MLPIPLCRTCGDEIEPPERARIQPTCLPCGEQAAINARKSWCVAPMHKSNYMLFTDPSLLLGINNKGGLVR